MRINHYQSAQKKKKGRYKLNLEGIKYDIIYTSSFMLHAIFSEYFLPTK